MPSNDQGFVLAFVLMLLALILGLTMASASLTLYNLKSGNAFYGIMKDQLFATTDGSPPASKDMLLCAPEGWDLLCFSTRITEMTAGAMQTCSWRVELRESFPDIPSGTLQCSSRPHVVVIIDDSSTMAGSSQQDYLADALYVKDAAGGITHVSEVCEIAESLTIAGLTYFSGGWGNSFQHAPPIGASSGAMSQWTLYFSLALSLIDSLGLCETAVMSTSRGLVTPFTTDRRKIAGGLEALSPSSAVCPLSEVLFQATSLFPSQCISSRHIIVVTAGVPMKDGHLPDWVRDFDHDGNARDTAFEKEGSHCLDDVSSYARSLGINVHVIGPASEFLTITAAKGGGRHMPERESIVPDGTLITRPAVLLSGSDLILRNINARMDPAWLKTDSCRFFRQSEANPLDRVSLPGLALMGLVLDSKTDETNLYCTTSCDELLKITLSSRTLEWMVKGIGAQVRLRGSRILAGPNVKGIITCMDPAPRLLWQRTGDCFDASGSTAYLGRGSSIHAHALEDGRELGLFDTNHMISMIRCDPYTACVYAGTSEGLVYVFTPQLELSGIVNTTMKDRIVEIRPFRLRKEHFFIVAAPGGLACHSLDRNVWWVPIDTGVPTGMVIMDGKVILSTWNRQDPCRGIEDGLSIYQEHDLASGKQILSETMFSGRAFGPSINPGRGIIRFISPSGTVHEKDISKVPGITPISLGRHLIRLVN